ncbi:MAG: hypothetical protein ABWX92_11720 [Mycetocola sp.]
MTRITIAEDVRLDLGHTDLVGTLVFEGDDLVLIAPSGTDRVLGQRVFHVSPENVMEAPAGHVFIEELGLASKLPAALVSLGCFAETNRHAGVTTWGADLVEVDVLVSAGAAGRAAIVGAIIESE